MRLEGSIVNVPLFAEISKRPASDFSSALASKVLVGTVLQSILPRLISAPPDWILMAPALKVVLSATWV